MAPASQTASTVIAGGHGRVRGRGDRISVPVVRLDPDLPLPGYARQGDAGADLVARTGVTLAAERRSGPGAHRRGRWPFPTGYAGFVQPRSGLALRHGVTCLNTPGLIDSGYRDELAVLLVNTDPRRTPTRSTAATGSPSWSSSGSRRRPSSRWTQLADERTGPRRLRIDRAVGAMERLTGLDGAFLSLESPDHPPAHPRRPGLRPRRGAGRCRTSGSIRSLVADRVPLVPPFRKRMVEVPFGLQHPAMVDDPDFDLDYHVRRVSLPGPGRAAGAGGPGGGPRLATARPAAAAVGVPRGRRAGARPSGPGAQGAPRHHRRGVRCRGDGRVLRSHVRPGAPTRCSAGRRPRRSTGRREPTVDRSRPRADGRIRTLRGPRTRCRARWSSGATCWAPCPGTPTRWCGRSPGPCRTARTPEQPEPARWTGRCLPPRSRRPAPRSTGPSRPTGGWPSPSCRSRMSSGSARCSAEPPTMWCWPSPAGPCARSSSGREEQPGELLGGHGAGLGADRGGAGRPGQSGVGHAGLAGRRDGGPGGPSPADPRGDAERPRSRAGRSGPDVFAGWAQALFPRWPPG